MVVKWHGHPAVLCKIRVIFWVRVRDFAPLADDMPTNQSYPWSYCMYTLCFTFPQRPMVCGLVYGVSVLSRVLRLIYLFSIALCIDATVFFFFDFSIEFSFYLDSL